MTPVPDAPGPEVLDRVTTALAPLRAVHDPQLHGIERVPAAGPGLLVGNHTIYGLVDVPLLFDAVYRERGRVLRSLGDHAHYAIPGWRELLTRYGTVRGTRENCRELMRQGELVLVFPGGGREVMKRKEEAYRLIWKERLGFVKLAAEHDYPLIPFGAVGVEEAYDIHLDAEDAAMAPARLIARLAGRPDMIPPLATGLGPTPLPRPERFYFGFGEPVATAGIDPEDERALRETRDRVRDSVEDQIAEMKRIRDEDPERYPPERLKRALGEAVERARRAIPNPL